jgi:ATP dependent DNA ligase domain
VVPEGPPDPEKRSPGAVGTAAGTDRVNIQRDHERRKSNTGRRADQATERHSYTVTDGRNTASGVVGIMGFLLYAAGIIIREVSCARRPHALYIIHMLRTRTPPEWTGGGPCIRRSPRVFASRLAAGTKTVSRKQALETGADISLKAKGSGRFPCSGLRNNMAWYLVAQEPESTSLGWATARRRPSLRINRSSLSESSERVPEGWMWIHEIKHDGYRLIVQRDGELVRLFTRRGHDWTVKYPQIVEAVAALHAQSIILDGEAVSCGVVSAGMAQCPR